MSPTLIQVREITGSDFCVGETDGELVYGMRFGCNTLDILLQGAQFDRMEGIKRIDERNAPGVLEFFGLSESDAGKVLVEPGLVQRLEKTRWPGLKGFGVSFIVTLSSEADHDKIEDILMKKTGLLILKRMREEDISDG